MMEKGTSRIGGIAVVIPCYRVTRHIREVLATIGTEVDRIYVVDDCCPEGSGRLVQQTNADSRVTVIFNSVNEGVGGATLLGMTEAFKNGAAIVVKIDGDGQMDPTLIPSFVDPLLSGDADYTKGNRFYELESIREIPRLRRFGNAGLSFASKLSSGYWDLFDPTNGYIAIHRSAFQRIAAKKVSRRYFFESDLLFRLYLAHAVVIDIPMNAIYRDETSNLAVRSVVAPFARKILSNFVKRICYTYFLRDFSIASIYLVSSGILLLSGVLFGATKWLTSASEGIEASAGTVMLSGLPIILGFQLLLGFLNFDMTNMPRYSLQRRSAATRGPQVSRG